MDFLSKKVKLEFGEERERGGGVMLTAGVCCMRLFKCAHFASYAGISCYMPANGETVSIAMPPVIEATISERLLKRTVSEMSGGLQCCCVCSWNRPV